MQRMSWLTCARKRQGLQLAATGLGDWHLLGYQLLGCQLLGCQLLGCQLLGCQLLGWPKDSNRLAALFPCSIAEWQLLAC
jgi:hypothetical protein